MLKRAVLLMALILPLFTHATHASEQPLIRSDYTSGEITRLCASAIQKINSEIEAIKARSRWQHYLFSRSLYAFERAAAELSDHTSPLIFMASVSTNEALRAEASRCEESIGQLYPTILADRKLYESLRRTITFGADQNRLAKETLRGFEKNGMALSEVKLSELKELKKRLASLQAKYSLNLNNDKTRLTFSRAELQGATPLFLNRLDKSGDGRYIVTLKSTDYIQVVENVTNPETRKRMIHAYLNRGGAENTALLESAIELRRQIAVLLGYATWADVQIDGRMAGTSKTVMTFLEGLRGKLIVRKNQDLSELLKFKRVLDPKATEVVAEDIAFLSAQLKKKAYALDEDQVAEYFPAERLMEGVFEIYSSLFGVKFTLVKNAPVWASGVTLYEVRDVPSGHLRAYFFLDTIPREGKYAHAAAFPLISGRDGSIPVSAIVANFTPPTKTRPSLFLHAEVETLFHEFGHIIHQTLTKAPYASLSGTAVAQDFVEAPSQMLENWIWNADILRQISSHYRTGEKIPTAIVEKLLAAKNFNQGFAYMRQLLFGLFDMRIHSSPGAVDVTKTYAEMHRELFGYSVVEGTHFPASFGHMMGGYDAGYYGYLWSEVYAQDMFSRFEAEGLLNSKTGADYRKAVLEVGNMRDAITLVRDFLGREPDTRAFYKKLGI